MRSKSERHACHIGLSFLFLVLMACSGGGDSSAPAPAPHPSPPTSIIIAGTASAGAPIAGQVYLKDSTGNILGPQTIAADGSFSFDITNMSAPFILLAEGTTGFPCRLMSMATGGGTANINPLTNLAVASLTGNSDAYANFNSVASEITTGAIADIMGKINAMLVNVLNAFSANIDPLAGAVPTNHQGLDGLFDVIKVDINVSSLELILFNKLTGEAIYTVNITSIASGTAPVISASDPKIPSIVSVAALNEIRSRLSSYTDVLKSKGIGLTAPDVADYYVDEATFGLQDGYTKTKFIALEANLLGRYSSLTITGISDVIPLAGQCDLSSNQCSLHIKWLLDDGSLGHGAYYTMVKDGGLWKITGNNYRTEAFIYPTSEKTYWTDGTSTIENGLRMEFYEPAYHGLEYAKVTGPGLPSQGVLFHRWAPYGVFVLDDASRAVSQRGNYIYYKELDIDTLPNTGFTQYQVQFFSDAGRTDLVEQRPLVLSSKPLKNTELTDGHFATMSHPATHVLSSFPPEGTYAFTYAPPSAYIITFLRYELHFWNDGTSGAVRNIFRKNCRLDGVDDSIEFIRDPGATNGATAIRSRDPYGRTFYMNWELD